MILICRQHKTRHALLICVVSALLLPQICAAQSFYTEGPDGVVTPVYNQDPSTASPNWWSVLCYRRGTQRGVKRNQWGSISGKSPSEVMARWKSEQRDEEAAERGSSYRSALTSFNCLGPVAVFLRRSVTEETSTMSFGSSAIVSQATAVVDRWRDQVQDAVLTALKEAEETPFDGVGSVLSEYKDQLTAAQQRARVLQGLLDHAAFGGDLDAAKIQQASNDLEESVVWLNRETPQLRSWTADQRARNRRTEEARQRAQGILEQNARTQDAIQRGGDQLRNTVSGYLDEKQREADAQDRRERARERQEARAREEAAAEAAAEQRGENQARHLEQSDEAHDEALIHRRAAEAQAYADSTQRAEEAEAEERSREYQGSTERPDTASATPRAKQAKRPTRSHHPR